MGSEAHLYALLVNCKKHANHERRHFFIESGWVGKGGASVENKSVWRLDVCSRSGGAIIVIGS